MIRGGLSKSFTEEEKALERYYIGAAASSANTPDGFIWDSLNDTYQSTGTNSNVIQKAMKRCVLNANGTVNYYLNQFNSAFKEDGVTPSVLDGTDGNVMVEIPVFWVKYTVVGDVKKIEISPVEREGFSRHKAFTKNGVEVSHRYYRAYEGFVSTEGLTSVSGVTPTKNQTIVAFRTQAKLTGAGWGITDWYLLDAVKTLYLVEYGTFNSQQVLGSGNNDGGDYGITTGQSNGIGNGSSDASNANKWMSYRGIENFYGDIWEFIDGINLQNRAVFLSDNLDTFESDVFTGDYLSTGVTMPSASASYIKNINFGADGFIPTQTGGSSSTYVTDGLWTGLGNRIAVHGGLADNSTLNGVYSIDCGRDSSNSSVGIGASVSF